MELPSSDFLERARDAFYRHLDSPDMIAAGPVGFTMTSVGAIMLLKEYPMPMSATTTIGGVALTALGLWNALRRE